MDVRSLLGESARAHLAYRMALRDGRANDAALALTSAFDYREQAETLDPSMTDPAWDDDLRSAHGITAPAPFTHRDAHRDLIEFYQKELARRG